MSGIQKPASLNKTHSTSSPLAPQAKSRYSENSGLKKAQVKSNHEVDALNASLQVKPQSPLPALSTLHRDLSKCPCNQSKTTWKIDCSKCHQFWHVDCLGLQGLTDKGYNKLTNFLCPFCFVAPIPTQASDVDICHVCRSTITLQQSNSQLEVSLAAEKLRSMGDFCEAVQKVDFDSLTAQLGTLESMDLHLQHFLIDKESLEEHHERTKKANETVLNLDKQMDQLKGQVAELINRPQLEKSGPSMLTDEFVADISQKLDQISAQEPVISTGLDNLRSSVDALERSTASAGAAAAAAVDSATTAAAAATAASSRLEAPPAVQSPSQLPPSEHGMAHVESSQEDFITAELETELIDMFQSSYRDDFKSEGGRSVLYFGEKYQYTGSTSSNRDRPVPQAISLLMQRINDELCVGETPKINSCLINRFEGSSGHLAQHSDNEATIHPESKIITLSLGRDCVLRFSDRGVANTVHEHQVSARSLYSMTRKSQDLFEHRIDHGCISEGMRYSLTFRSISRLNRNATCIFGDSNTGGLRFGDDPKRSFGKSLPGKRISAPVLGDINPYDSCGFSNVVIMCGINNIKTDNIRTPGDIRCVYNLLVSKIQQIQLVNPKSHVYVCPVLPTKRAELNRKGVFFNNLIMNELLASNFGVTFVDGFQAFLDEQGLLNREMSRDFNKFKRPDFLHLNWTGLAKLGCLIRDTVLFRVSGVRKRKRTREVDGTAYRDVAASGVERHEGYQSS